MFGFGDLWQKLVTEELGHSRFGAHGGDWGSIITEQLARSHASSVVGIHLTDVPFWHISRRQVTSRRTNRSFSKETSAGRRKMAPMR